MVVGNSTVWIWELAAGLELLAAVEQLLLDLLLRVVCTPEQLAS